ncbi:hypothetical protein GGR53DRAFT_207907 [Hypoxylon sp. FL1150]|nr:hypothetical protein GGR53DRAFT_207907 [Hypoxylon sp. FL1150]
MDSKRTSEELPPYTAFPTNNMNPDEIPVPSLTSHLQNHVRSLPDRIRTTQQVRKAEQEFTDAPLLDRLATIIEDFLVELGSRHDPVPLATLALVPDGAVPKEAKLSGLEDMNGRGELSRVVKVYVEGTGKGLKSNSDTCKPHILSEDSSWAAGQEFSDWGRFGETSSSTRDGSEDRKMLWWRDEMMAHRLANSLQPKREKKAHAELNSVVEAVVEQRKPSKKEKRGWTWGRRGGAKDSPEASSKPVVADVRANELEDGQGENEAEMVVTAQEVAFRHENEFGIWESIRGWGIVVAVKIGK